MIHKIIYQLSSILFDNLVGSCISIKVFKLLVLGVSGAPLSATTCQGDCLSI